MRKVFVFQEGDTIAKLIADDLRVHGHETVMLEKGVRAPSSTIPIVTYIPERRRASLPTIHRLGKDELYGNIKKRPEWIEGCEEWILVEYSPLQVVAWIADQITHPEPVPASAAA